VRGANVEVRAAAEEEGREGGGHIRAQD